MPKPAALSLGDATLRAVAAHSQGVSAEDVRNYLAGEAFTLADIGLGIWVHRWHIYPIERPELPRLKAWYGRLGERPGFRDHVAGPVS